MANFTVLLSTTTSSAPGASTPCVISWRGAHQPTTVSVYGTSISSASFLVQYTLDDLQLVGGASLAYWAGVSSAQNNPATVFAASAGWPDGALVTFSTPIAAVRMNSSALVSGPLTMKVLQGN